MTRLRHVVLDIEGTVLPIAFVRNVLFPYARRRMKGFLQANAADAEIRSALSEVERLAPGRDPLASLFGWMDQDAKITPLKTLQGLIWKKGYLDGELVAPLYPDVPPALARWREAGMRLHIYSSGSVSAQRLVFGHGPTGDLTPLIDGYFDTMIGGKREAESYRRIAGRIACGPADILFLSDVEAELDAAVGAGWRARQVVRAEDGTAPSPRHPHAATLDEVAIP